MSNSKPVVAYQVDRNDGEGSVVIFSTHGLEARRKGAYRLECEFEDCTSTVSNNSINMLIKASSLSKRYWKMVGGYILLLITQNWRSQLRAPPRSNMMITMTLYTLQNGLSFLLMREVSGKRGKKWRDMRIASMKL